VSASRLRSEPNHEIPRSPENGNGTVTEYAVRETYRETIIIGLLRQLFFSVALAVMDISNVTA